MDFFFNLIFHLKSYLIKANNLKSVKSEYPMEFVQPALPSSMAKKTAQFQLYEALLAQGTAC